MNKHLDRILTSACTIACFLTMLFNGSHTNASTPPDSLRVRWMEGKKYILHKVDSKETLETVARRYKVTVNEIKSANSGIRDIREGQIINIPAKSSFTQVGNTPPAKPNVVGKKVPVYYTVKHGDTMYSISKSFNTTVEDIMKYNSLPSYDLKLDQRIIVSYKGGDEITSQADFSTPENTIASNEETPSVVNIEVATPMVADAISSERPTRTVSEVKKAPGGKTLMQVTETGVATWIQESDFGKNKFYALHRTAPIGTIIKVTNRMNGIAVYVKVVGVLPDTGENDNIIIKVSQSVSNRLNALDPLFQAELTYGVVK